MKKTYSSLLLLGAILFLSSCQKEKNNNNNDDDGCAATVASVSGTYKLTALKYRPSANASEIDYFGFLDDCEKDDLTDLLPNGTYNYRDIGTPCSPSGTNNGTWSINGNTIISDGFVAGTITSFDCRKLVLYTENLIAQGDKVTMTLEKQ